MAARCTWKKPPTRRAGWFASASGTAMSGVSAASRSATDLIDWRASRVLIEARPISRPGFFFDRSRSPGERSDPGDRVTKPPAIRFGWHRPRISLRASGLRKERRASQELPPRAHGAQHRFARPAVDLEAGGFLICAQRRAGLHAGLAVELVLVETDARQMTLHGFDIGTC